MDDQGRVLYVGKAKNLRARLSNYFQDPSGLSERIRTMVYTAESVRWVVVGSEVEALTLEYSWIKEFTPPFNVVFRDNKSYPYLAISESEKYPRVWVTRQEHRKGTRYLGPYTKVWAIRETLDQLLTVFPARSCTKGQFNQAERMGRPCLYGHIGKCCAPCVGKVSEAKHREIVNNLISFMEGSTRPAIAQRTRLMMEAASNEEFETAARYRDEIQALQAVNERNVVVLNDDLDADIFGIAHDELEASVQVFYVRGGRIRGQQAWVSEETGNMSLGDIVSDLILQVYGASQFDSVPTGRASSTSVDDREHTPLGAIPSQIWVPELPPDREELQAWLRERRAGPVHLKVPVRGEKAQLAQTVHLNAEQALQRHKLARAGDITVRSQALEELRDVLGLKRAPLRIECYDVSHTQGTHQVASMVVFEDGLAKKADYRHFIVRGPQGNGAQDDTAAMGEVLRRRLLRLVSGAAGDDTGEEDEDVPSTSITGGNPQQDEEKNAHRNNDASEIQENTGLTSIQTRPDSSPIQLKELSIRTKDADIVTVEKPGLAGDTYAAKETVHKEKNDDSISSSERTVDSSERTQEKTRRFAYKPDVIVVDGGLPQVNAAQRVVEETGADVTVIGLAKRLEEVWLPGEEFPVILPRTSPSLRLLQQLRDESHRFAITFHRKKRAKAMTRSALDAIAGLGPAKQKSLLSAMGSVANIRQASRDELMRVPGVGPALAQTIVEHFHPHEKHTERPNNVSPQENTSYAAEAEKNTHSGSLPQSEM